jgi:choline dehydrogenase
VLLLEAGPTDWHPFVHMPAGLAKLVGDKGVNWDYNTEPEAQLGGRRLWWPRGRVLGGSSSINAMCYIRGHRLDYDEWDELGASGWHWDNVLPYFRRAEGNARKPNRLHNDKGPLAVSDPRHTNPLSAVFVEGRGAGGTRARRRFQRRVPGRLRLVPDHHPQGRAQLGRGGLPQARAQA